MEDSSWNECQAVVVTGRAVVLARVVAESGSCSTSVGGGGIERLVAASATKTLMSQTNFRTHF